MSIAVEQPSFDYHEWHRLSALSDKYEPKMRLAYTRAIRSFKTVDPDPIHMVINQIIAAAGLSSSKVYGLEFDIDRPEYMQLSFDLLTEFVTSINPPKAKQEVEAIIPSGLNAFERKKRIDATFGLDAQSALRVERYRQTRGSGPTADRDVEAARRDSIRMRGNLLAITETNRAINRTLETLWLANMGEIYKADNVVYLDRSIRGNSIPRFAQKEWVTRRDGRVCKYCDELDGIVARIGQEFNTEYGLFLTPPIHPRCRCFVIISKRTLSSMVANAATGAAGKLIGLVDGQ